MSPSQLFRIEAHPFQAPPPATRWDDSVAVASLIAFFGMVVFLLVR